MFCPTCQTVVPAGPSFCPTCGDTMRDVSAADTVEVVEGSAAVTLELPELAPDNGEQPANSDTPLALALRRPPGTPVPALMRAGQLAVAAWRQPAVRAAVKTGATAVALSLTVRAARQALTLPRARRLPARSPLPSLVDLFTSEREPRTGEYEVVETYFYMRRVVRR